MPHATFTSTINAPVETVWALLLDKVEHPERYIPAITGSEILGRYHDGVLREMKTEKMKIKERISLDEQAREIRFTLVDHPFFTGQTINRLLPPLADFPNDPVTLTFALDWQPSNAQASAITQTELDQTLKHAVLETKSRAEQAKQLSTERPEFKPERLPGVASAWIREMFKAGESMHVENFIKFYTETAHYQFSNFPVVYGPQGIRETSGPFLEKVKAVTHHIKAMWECGDIVICEMEVVYTRHDGRVFTLPCCDTIRMQGDKVHELRIYMDISPVFS